MKNKNQLTTIRKQLKRGDMTYIANINGFHRGSVARMFSGKSEMHPLVWESAIKLIENRRKKIDEAINQ